MVLDGCGGWPRVVVPSVVEVPTVTVVVDPLFGFLPVCEAVGVAVRREDRVREEAVVVFLALGVCRRLLRHRRRLLLLRHLLLRALVRLAAHGGRWGVVCPEGVEVGDVRRLPHEVVVRRRHRPRYQRALVVAGVLVLGVLVGNVRVEVGHLVVHPLPQQLLRGCR